MPDEAGALAETLAHTALVVAQAKDPRRVRAGYDEGRALAASLGGRTVRERVTACLERFHVLRELGDEACAGWMLVAIEVRLGEPGLREAERLRVVVERTLRHMRDRTAETVH